MPPRKRPISNGQPCPHFAQGRCTWGTACRFSHGTTAQLENAQRRSPFSLRPSAQPHEQDQAPSELTTWNRLLAKSSTAVPLGHNLSRFFQLAWKLVSEGAAETRQEIISKLASEGGVCRINELANISVPNLNTHRATTFRETVSPLFRILAHEEILCSLLLENSVDTIHNFLFGPSGRRSLKLFGWVLPTLSHMVCDTGDGPQRLVHIAACLVVFQKTIDLNGTAQILEDFNTMVKSLSDVCDEKTFEDAGSAGRRILQSLARIQQRLGIGSAMPRLESTAQDQSIVPTAVEIPHDLPGQRSMEGPRHDNDHENITDINIMPTAQEIQSQRSEYIPFHDAATWHIPGTQGLLDRLFRLLREDTIGQLRDAVGTEIEKLRNPQAQATPKQQQGARTFTYHNPQVVHLEMDKLKGFKMMIEFDQPKALRKLHPTKRKAWWEASRQLQPGSLLCLAEAAGGTLFLRSLDQFEKKDPNPENQEVGHGNLFEHPHRSVGAFCLLDCNEESVSNAVSLFKSRRYAKKSLVEFPGILLQAFRPILQVLQQIARSGELPFSEFLAPSLGTIGEFGVPPPLYAQRTGFRFDLSCIMHGNQPLELAPNEYFDLQALTQSSTLDEAQARALVNSLSRRLALNQGPPGSGKSFTGVALIKVLLHNRIQARLGPIVCVCYTNHALDQLLEHLVKDDIKGIVRIGSRSKSALLEPLNLITVSRGQDKTKTERRSEWERRVAIDSCVDRLKDLLRELRYLGSGRSIKSYLQTYHPQHHEALFGSHMDGFRIVHHDLNKVIPQWLNAPGPTRQSAIRPKQDRPVSLLTACDVHAMTPGERQRLHGHWVSEINDDLSRNLCAETQAYDRDREAFFQCRQELDLRCLQASQVIGVTTTGLANNINLLRRLPSKVLVCEEAGEVLEAHIVTAMLPRIEHAILIGDHQQLRPQIQNYDLQSDNPRGAKYSLDVSLFERLVAPANEGAPRVPFDTLEIQRRMHPSIAELVRQTLYPKLQDHSSVSDYPEVPGLAKRLFWLDHRESEAQQNLANAAESTSHSNDYEVEMTAALVSHLIRQDAFKSDEIAVLTPYLGQLRKLRARMSRSFEIFVGDRDIEDLDREGLNDVDPEIAARPKKTALAQALRIATVDNFQGEEARVVVISLVRSNASNRCGFLRTSNRINVLLSRARHGMYIIGNSQTSSPVPMWAEVLSILRDGQNIGSALPLRCPRHPEIDIEVKCPDDFTRFAPEGGCNQKCIKRLPCGHSCINRCHAEALHRAVVCLESCPRSKPGCDHPCPRNCGQECEEQCNAPVSNVPLGCGHVCATLKCHQTQDPSTVRCKEKVQRVVHGCGHTVSLPCYVDVTKEGFQCPSVCGAILPCGHPCTRGCKTCNVRQKGQLLPPKHGTCQTKCDRQYNNCSHRCSEPCHEGKGCPLCEAPCEVQCEHSRCSKKCQEPCAPCAEPCRWTCPHQEGRCQMPCAVPCDLLPCSKRCTEQLSCGHQCPSICGERCPPTEFCQTCAASKIKDSMVDYIMQSSYGDTDLDEDPVIIPSCGHIMTLSSMDGHMGMAEYYDLSDTSAVTALKPMPETFSTDGLKVCPVCRGSLRNLNRYNRIVRQLLLEQSTKKFIAWANQEFLPLQERLFEEEMRVQESTEAMIQMLRTSGRTSVDEPRPAQALTLEGGPGRQIAALLTFPALRDRYHLFTQLRTDISKFLRRVSETEQPFGRVFDMVRDIRRRRGIEATMQLDRSVLNTRNRLLATSLAIRCDLAVLSDFVALRQKCAAFTQIEWIAAELKPDFSQNRKECQGLLEEALARDQPMQAVEARVGHARWSALEGFAPPSNPKHAEGLRASALYQLAAAEETCKDNPGSTRGMEAQIAAVRKMVQESSFYSVVDNEEKRQVYAAMANEFWGTGHWYRCANGHPFTVGECGAPMQTARCPQCGATIGGASHTPADGVTRDADFERQFGGLHV